MFIEILNEEKLFLVRAISFHLQYHYFYNYRHSEIRRGNKINEWMNN